MLIGEYRHSLDKKGRIAVPAKLRQEVGATAVVTKGLDGCLYLYPRVEWEVIAGKLRDLPLSSSSARAFSRLMLSGAMEVEIDKLGRALIPGYLRDFAAIEDEVVITGVGSHLEIWDRKNWELYAKEAEANSVENAEELAEYEI